MFLNFSDNYRCFTIHKCDRLSYGGRGERNDCQNGVHLGQEWVGKGEMRARELGQREPETGRDEQSSCPQSGGGERMGEDVTLGTTNTFYISCVCLNCMVAL